MRPIVLISCFVVAAYAIPYAAESCTSSICKIEDGCRCASQNSPIAVSDTPQLITLTFNDAVTDIIYHNYFEPLLIGRKNPDGVQIGATFYVPHEYTDYEMVNKLYNYGMEIAVHSISRNPLSDYWKQASEDTLYDEFYGQKQILSNFANIPIDSVVGARTPGFEINGDKTFRAYERAGIQYDNSCVLRSSAMTYPFSLHYKSFLYCEIGTCPTESFPKTWMMPVISHISPAGVECSAVAACLIESTSTDSVKNWFMTQFTRHYNSNKSPLTININAGWLEASDFNWPGLVAFLDELTKYSDVFLVDHKQVLNWMKNPIPVSQFATATTPKSASCVSNTCVLLKGEELRYMKTCTYLCPDVFPWVGNPLGQI